MGEATTTKPDGNNVLAGVLDGLTGVLVQDDKSVWRCSVEKRWGELDRTVITVGWERNGSHPIW
jgi:Holliday junction resolvase RusA-like endonuclease